MFLDAIRHAKSVGFHRLHVATNGIRFAQEEDFAVRAKAAGLHGVYLQFDGVTEENNSHQVIGNYMETRRRALDNIAASGSAAVRKSPGLATRVCSPHGASYWPIWRDSLPFAGT